MRYVLLVAAVLVGAVSGRADAQTTDPTPPRFEVGGYVGVMAGTDFEDTASVFVWGPRASVRVTDRLGVEVSTDLRIASYTGGYRSLYGTYYLAGKYSFRRALPNRLRLFATFGGAGSFARATAPAYTRTFPDGVRVTVGERTVSTLERPRGLVGGIGVERPVSRHLAFRASAEGVFGEGLIFGMRLCAGVSVPIGGYPRQ